MKINKVLIILKTKNQKSDDQFNYIEDYIFGDPLLVLTIKQTMKMKQKNYCLLQLLQYNSMIMLINLKDPLLDLQDLNDINIGLKFFTIPLLEVSSKRFTNSSNCSSKFITIISQLFLSNSSNIFRATEHNNYLSTDYDVSLFRFSINNYSFHF
ncbi:unnamed protein product [Paramecium octaurelia]|uniref:Uncharacterized protein n=1 Tax=Paramecium octaurelia TaxID=43137 RepID=A0A8S1WLY8_PAROT|nr:unnamed protein product [Paramecium octaurelia]